MLRQLLAAGQLVTQHQPHGVQHAAAWAAASWAKAWSATSAGHRPYHVCQLASRGVISVKGDDAVQFMQGMTTNDLRALEQPGSGPVYTVLLTAKGKYLHDLFAYSIPGDQQQLLLDVDAAGVSSALQWLSRYKLRRKLDLQDFSGRVAVWAAFDGQLKAGPAGQWRQDPRLPDLGLRGLFDVQQLPPPPAEAGGTSSRKQRAAGMSVVGDDAHRRWRYQLGIAEGDQEIPSGEVAPLECNLDALNGISYTKGCYIGQERNSYTHYRGIIRRRMMPVRLKGLDEASSLPCPVPIVAADAGQHGGAGISSSSSSRRSIGTLTGHVEDLGMAYMTLAPALAVAEGRAPPLRLQLDGRTVEVVPQRPAWWPADWGLEEHRGSTNAP